jgi:hypothetical protein
MFLLFCSYSSSYQGYLKEVFLEKLIVALLVMDFVEPKSLQI